MGEIETLERIGKEIKEEITAIERKLEGLRAHKMEVMREWVRLNPNGDDRLLGDTFDSLTMFIGEKK